MRLFARRCGDSVWRRVLELGASIVEVLMPLGGRKDAHAHEKARRAKMRFAGE